MRLRAMVFFIAFLAVSVASLGQGFQGGLRGSARDAGGALVPGLEIKLTNESTSLSRTTVTNDSGEYSFAALDPGSYRLNASLTGFRVIDLTGIRVGTQQFVTLDLKLEVGALAEAISVTAEVPLIETSNASQGTVLDTQSLQTLPAPGRNAFMIGVSVPTVIPSGDTQFNRQQDQTNASLLSLGGGTRRGNNYTLDGVPITDLRNRAIPKPTNPYYLGGGGFGGPIIKNRTFFWVAAEDYHDVQTRSLSVIMPTAAERAGDFSALTDVQGRPVIIYDPLTIRIVNGA